MIIQMPRFKFHFKPHSSPHEFKEDVSDTALIFILAVAFNLKDRHLRVQ